MTDNEYIQKVVLSAERITTLESARSRLIDEITNLCPNKCFKEIWEGYLRLDLSFANAIAAEAAYLAGIRDIEHQ